MVMKIWGSFVVVFAMSFVLAAGGVGYGVMADNSVQAGFQNYGFNANGSQMRLQVQEHVVNGTGLLGGNATGMKVRLSNGNNFSVNVLPDQAAVKAMQRLQLRNCSDECNFTMSEIGQGNQTRLAYSLSTQRGSKLFGLFNAGMNVSVTVDAETGDIVSVKKPWWAFMASESEE